MAGQRSFGATLQRLAAAVACDAHERWLRLVAVSAAAVALNAALRAAGVRREGNLVRFLAFDVVHLATCWKRGRFSSVLEALYCFVNSAVLHVMCVALSKTLTPDTIWLYPIVMSLLLLPME
jgi:hypothetical protein